jgi:ADP-ribose pyrophosphatase YjhB (NUDIX family)
MIVGTDCIGVRVGAMVLNKDGKVFLAQRGPKATNEKGYWEFPGGQVEFGEKLVDALKREYVEEYNLEIKVIELLSINDHILKNEKQHWVSPTFIARYVSGDPSIREPGKCISIGWFYLSNLPKPLSFVTARNWLDYRSKHGFQGIW